MKEISEIRQSLVIVFDIARKEGMIKANPEGTHSQYSDSNAEDTLDEIFKWGNEPCNNYGHKLLIGGSAYFAKNRRTCKLCWNELKGK